MSGPFASRRTALALIGAALLLPTPALAAPFTSNRIVVTQRGQGRDVILVPGLGSGPDVWERLIRDVPGCRWHLVQVRGFAGLAAGANAKGPLLEPLADEIARYAVWNRLAAPAIIGHSMGGLLAMLVALRHPAQAGRVMVVDMLPYGAGMVGGTPDGLGFLAQQLRGYFTGTQGGRRAFAQLVRDATPGMPQSDPDVIAAALGEIAQIDLSTPLRRSRIPLTAVPALPRDSDARATLLADTRRAWAGIPVQLRPVEQSGHMVMLDQPSRFAALVTQFLQSR